MAVDDWHAGVDGEGAVNFDAGRQLQLAPVVGRNLDDEFVAALVDPDQGDGSGKAAVVGVGVLAASLGDVGSQCAVIDSAARCAVDLDIERTHARRRKRPTGDNDDLARDER